MKSVRDEHKQAIDWLNEHTDERINLFAVEMELWRIGDSPYAPRFRIVSQPNDWAKAVRTSTGQSALSETKIMQQEFWAAFREFASGEGTKLRLRKAYPQHWYDVSIGVSKAYLSLVVDTQGEQLRCELYIPDNKDLFRLLLEKRGAIESSLGYELDWMELPGKKASRIKTALSIDVNDNVRWPECHGWLLTAAEKFEAVFGKQIRRLKA